MSKEHDDPTGAADDQPVGRWLSIDAACRLLGVDQSTLRRWSDQGKIPVSRTPGGHRRYNEEDLRAFMQGQTRPRRRMTHRLLTDLSFSAYETDYLRQARSRPWYSAYNPRQIDELRALGRRLVALAVRTISGRTDRDQLLDEGRAIGRRYGALGAEAGLSSSDAVEAFLFFPLPGCAGRRALHRRREYPGEARGAHLRRDYPIHGSGLDRNRRRPCRRGRVASDASAPCRAR